MSRPIQRAQPSKRPAYTVSDDWTSAGGGLKKLRLCALEKTRNGSSELSTAFQETATMQADTTIRPGMIGPSIPIPPEMAKKFGIQPGHQPTQQQVVAMQQQMRMQQMAQLQDNAMQREGSNMEQRPASSPTPNSNHAPLDRQFQLMLLEQQNKKRLLMARQEKDNMTNEPKIPLPDGDGFNRKSEAENFGLNSEHETLGVPLHQVANSSSVDRRRTRFTRQISSQLTTHTHQSGGLNTTQSLQQSSTMSMLSRPPPAHEHIITSQQRMPMLKISYGQPTQTAPATRPQPTPQSNQQIEQMMVIPGASHHQQMQQRLLTQRQREMDARPFPPRILNDFCSVPPNVRTWGQLKEFVQQNQQILPPDFLDKVRRYQLIVIQKQQQQTAMANANGSQMAGQIPQGAVSNHLITAGSQAPVANTDNTSMPSVTEQELQDFKARIPAAQGWSHEQLRKNFMQWKQQKQQMQKR